MKWPIIWSARDTEERNAARASRISKRMGVPSHSSPVLETKETDEVELLLR